MRRHAFRPTLDPLEGRVSLSRTGPSHAETMINKLSALWQIPASHIQLWHGLPVVNVLDASGVDNPQDRNLYVLDRNPVGARVIGRIPPPYKHLQLYPLYYDD